jgi:hypothetical protein
VLPHHNQPHTSSPAPANSQYDIQIIQLADALRDFLKNAKKNM